MKETQKNLMQDMSKLAFRQFEVKGYERMLDRMLDQPLQGAVNKNNVELQEKLMHIKQTLTKQ